MGYANYISLSLTKVNIRSKEITSVNIYRDNQGTIALVKNPHLYK